MGQEREQTASSWMKQMFLVQTTEVEREQQEIKIKNSEESLRLEFQVWESREYLVITEATEMDETEQSTVYAVKNAQH